MLSGSDYLFKLLLIGDSGVGKSCLLLRFAVSFQILELSILTFFSSPAFTCLNVPTKFLID